MRNKYDRLLILLIGALSLGGLGGYLMPCRVLTILLLPQLWKIRLICKFRYRSIISFMLFFISYCFISLLWTPDKVEGMKEIVYYSVHFIYFLEIITFSVLAKDFMRSISLGWLLVVFISASIGIYEIVTDTHFGIGQEAERMINMGGGRVFQQRFAKAFFANYNSLVTVFCFAFSFVLYFILKTEKKNLLYILAIITLFLSFIVVIVNASRGGILSLGVMFVIPFLLSKNRKLKYGIMAVLAIGFVWLFSHYYDLIFGFLELRFSNVDVTHDDTRMLLLKKGLQICYDSFGFGSGVGSIVAKLEVLNPGGITITHNMFMEFLSQYGVLFFLIFVGFLLKQFKKIRKIADSDVRHLMYALFIAMPFMMAVDSGYLLYPQLFAFFASMYVSVNLQNYTSLN